MTPSAQTVFENARRRAAGPVRDAFIAGACGDDVALRAAVEKLLEGNAGAEASDSDSIPEHARDTVDARGDAGGHARLARVSGNAVHTHEIPSLHATPTQQPGCGQLIG